MEVPNYCFKSISKHSSSAFRLKGTQVKNSGGEWKCNCSGEQKALMGGEGDKSKAGRSMFNLQYILIGKFKNNIFKKNFMRLRQQDCCRCEASLGSRVAEGCV